MGGEAIEKPPFTAKDRARNEGGYLTSHFGLFSDGGKAMKPNFPLMPWWRPGTPAGCF